MMMRSDAGRNTELGPRLISLLTLGMALALMAGCEPAARSRTNPVRGAAQPTSATVDSVVVDQGVQAEAYGGRATVNLQRIDLTANGHMVWHLDFISNASREVGVALDLGATHVVDEAGNRFPVWGTDIGDPFALPPTDTVHHWLEFDGPVSPALSYTLALERDSLGSVLNLTFPALTVRLTAPLPTAAGPVR